MLLFCLHPQPTLLVARTSLFILFVPVQNCFCVLMHFYGTSCYGTGSFRTASRAVGATFFFASAVISNLFTSSRNETVGNCGCRIRKIPAHTPDNF